MIFIKMEIFIMRGARSVLEPELLRIKKKILKSIENIEKSTMKPIGKNFFLS
jgi:hypothetical protein